MKVDKLFVIADKESGELVIRKSYLYVADAKRAFKCHIPSSSWDKYGVFEIPYDAKPHAVADKSGKWTEVFA